MLTLTRVAALTGFREAIQEWTYGRVLRPYRRGEISRAELRAGMRRRAAKLIGSVAIGLFAVPSVCFAVL